MPKRYPAQNVYLFRFSLSLPKLFKTVSGHGLVYGVGSVASKLIWLALLPIFTRTLSPSEFGTIEILQLFASITLTFVICGTDASLSYYFFRNQKTSGNISSQAQYTSAALAWRTLIGFCILLFVICFANYLPLLKFSIPTHRPQIFLVLLGGLIPFIQGLELYRYTFRSVPYIIVTTISTSLSVLVSYWLVVHLSFGVTGYLVGPVIGGVVGLLFSWLGNRKYLVWPQRITAVWKDLLSFGLPLLPSNLLFWLFLSLDRWFLLAHSLSEVGIYGIALRISTAMGVLVEAFRTSWTPISLKILEEDHAGAVFQKTAITYLAGGISIVILFSAASQKIFQILTAPEFHAGYPVVGFISFYHLLYGFIPIASLGAWKKKRTIIVTYSLLFAALSNLFLNWLLVPHYGSVGASIGTCYAMFFGVLFLLWRSESIHSFGHSFPRILFLFIICLSTIHLQIYLNRHFRSALVLWGASLASILLIARISMNDLLKRSQVARFATKEG